MRAVAERRGLVAVIRRGGGDDQAAVCVEAVFDLAAHLVRPAALRHDVDSEHHAVGLVRDTRPARPAGKPVYRIVGLRLGERQLVVDASERVLAVPDAVGPRDE
jgi:hypothetical protein